MMIMTLFLPQVAVNVPQYMMYNKFDSINDPLYPALWVPSLFATETYFIYQLGSFMRSIRTTWTKPPPLTAAARSRSCTRSSAPCSAPLWSPVRCLCGAATTFMGPLLYVTTPRKYPMAIFVKPCLWTVPVKAFSGTASPSLSLISLSRSCWFSFAAPGFLY